MSDEEQSPIDARKDAEAHLAELAIFLKSRVYANYVSARTQEIADTEQSILMNEPIDRKDEIEGFKMRGELRLLRELVTIFEDSHQILKARIEEMLERENQMVSKDKQ